MRILRLLPFVALGAGITIAVIAILVAISTTRLNHVEVAAQGAPGITMTFADDSRSYIEEWPLADGWWKRYTTTAWSAYVTVTAPDDDTASDTVSCRILWNDRVVAEETSETGQATCRYEARFFGLF